MMRALAFVMETFAPIVQQNQRVKAKVLKFVLIVNIAVANVNLKIWKAIEFFETPLISDDVGVIDEEYEQHPLVVMFDHPSQENSAFDDSGHTATDTGRIEQWAKHPLNGKTSQYYRRSYSVCCQNGEIENAY